MKAPYPPSEVGTWERQRQEARAFADEASAPTPLLIVIAQAAGRTVAALAAMVQQRASAWEAAAGEVIGTRISLTAQIEAATSTDEVQAVVWPST
ncbi:hypothetical protein [Pandoraea communis]|uniref:hypothetical protein n=1 Tax=Pandoraea communis TaxID=2508297 RepID=UPI001241D7FD|nr:hypothetical protein [Pandoraea communis]